MRDIDYNPGYDKSLVTNKKLSNIKKMKKGMNKMYDGWVLSNNFWKRALAIWFHGWVINTLILIILFSLLLSFLSLTGSF